jgi:hypothetical protein
VAAVDLEVLLLAAVAQPRGLDDAHVKEGAVIQVMGCFGDSIRFDSIGSRLGFDVLDQKLDGRVPNSLDN